ncbi:uncharacterized protein TNCV_5040341 [Trichonephila clavipes]|nr:uncharacterized protein TNCV_5040341 [Trichonephila clavipes]
MSTKLAREFNTVGFQTDHLTGASAHAPQGPKVAYTELGTPTLRCRREAGVSPLLSIGWWYLSSVSPKRHCRRVSAADKGCRVYPLDPRPDAVVLYSGCTPGKRRAWFLPDDRHTASLVGLRGGWRHSRTKLFTRTYGSEYAVPG